MKVVSRESVLEKAVELAAEYEESLTLRAFLRETDFTQGMIFDLFGSWCNLRVAVGLTPDAPRSRSRVSKEKVLQLAREQAAIHGERLTGRMFYKETGLSERLVTARFGTWGALREKIGLKPRASIPVRYSDEEMMLDMYRVYRKCRVSPVSNRHRYRGGKISPDTITKRFGCWSGAKLYFAQFLRDHGLQSSFGPLPEELENKFREREM